MKRWGFNYRLFFKKNMTGLTVLALFGASAAVWDNDLFLKSIALSEIMPKRTVTTVSYTHLDVYKRQVIYGIVGAVIGSLAAISIDSDMLRKIFAVFLVFMGIGELRKK